MLRTYSKIINIDYMNTCVKAGDSYHLSRAKEGSRQTSQFVYIKIVFAEQPYCYQRCVKSKEMVDNTLI